MDTKTMSETERRLEMLDSRLEMNLSLNDLRILVGCFRGLEYETGMDAASYLDADGLSLKQRLEQAYRSALVRLGFPASENPQYAAEGVGTV